MRKKILAAIISLVAISIQAQVPFRHDLQFTALAKTWDEALPLDNREGGKCACRPEASVGRA